MFLLSDSQASGLWPGRGPTVKVSTKTSVACCALRSLRRSSCLGSYCRESQAGILKETLYYAILYSTLLYSTLLYSTILYYTILYHTIFLVCVSSVKIKIPGSDVHKGSRNIPASLVVAIPGKRTLRCQRTRRRPPTLKPNAEPPSSSIIRDFILEYIMTHYIRLYEFDF